MRPTTPILDFSRQTHPSSPPETPRTATFVPLGKPIPTSRRHGIPFPFPLSTAFDQGQNNNNGEYAIKAHVDGQFFNYVPSGMRSEDLSPRSSTPDSISSGTPPRSRSSSPDERMSSSPPPLTPQPKERVVSEGNFTVEEIRESDYEEYDSDNDDIIRPDLYEEAESEATRSVNGKRSFELDTSFILGMRDLDCDDSSAYASYEACQEARRQEKRRKRRLSVSAQKRTLSQSIGSDTDDEDLQPQHLDVSEVGSSARRLRRKLAGDRTSLIFDDPPPRIEELEEPESCESVLDIGEGDEVLAQRFGRELPYYVQDMDVDTGDEEKDEEDEDDSDDD
ncbi:hypothetical protein F5884DRAFT_23996 [Xylogone sp. PMI_703]|nr:hypothetical protein F5884DRAFT_23996 [Xylogone sp. PMI_703]